MDNSKEVLEKKTKFTVVGAGWAGVRTAIGLVDSIENTLHKLQEIHRQNYANQVLQEKLAILIKEGNFALDMALVKEKNSLENLIKIIDNFEVELWDSNKRPFEGISGNFGIRAHSGLHYPNSKATIENCKRSLQSFTNDSRFNHLLVKTEAYYAFTKADFKGNKPKVSIEHFRKVADTLGATELGFENNKYISSEKTITVANEHLEGLWRIEEPSMKLGEPLRKSIEILIQSRQPRLVCKFNRRLKNFFVKDSHVRLIYQESHQELLQEDNSNFFINATSFQGFVPHKNYTWKMITESDSIENALENNGFIYVQSLDNHKPNKLFYRYQTGEIEEVIFTKPNEINAELDVFLHSAPALLIEKAINNLGGRMPKDASPMFDAKYIYQPSNNFVVRRKKTDKPPISFIVMDGLNPCLMPICDDNSNKDEYEYYLLTHGAFTNLASCKTPEDAYGTLKSLIPDEQKNLYELTINDMGRYYPEFCKEFEYVGSKQAVLGKFVAKTEFRSSTVFGEYKKENEVPQLIHIFPGKVTDDPSKQVMNLYSAAANSARHKELINHAGVLVVKDDVMHIGSQELGQRMSEQEKQVCSGHLDTLNQFRTGILNSSLNTVVTNKSNGKNAEYIDNDGASTNSSDKNSRKSSFEFFCQEKSVPKARPSSCGTDYSKTGTPQFELTKYCGIATRRPNTHNESHSKKINPFSCGTI